jgi:hypothetical protein
MMVCISGKRRERWQNTVHLCDGLALLTYPPESLVNALRMSTDQGKLLRISSMLANAVVGNDHHALQVGIVRRQRP